MTASRKSRAKAVPIPENARQAIKLPAQGAVGGSLLNLVEGAIQEALKSNAARLLIAGYLEGKGLEGVWDIRMKDMVVGEFFLIPRPRRIEGLPANEELDPAKPAKEATASL